MAYLWKDKKDKSQLELKLHGNSTSVNKPYIRTSATALKRIKKASLQYGSATMKYNNLIKNCKNEPSLSELPKSRNQIYKHKSLQAKKNNKNISTHDEYADALINRQKS